LVAVDVFDNRPQALRLRLSPKLYLQQMQEVAQRKLAVQILTESRDQGKLILSLELE
jgi:hypothetical protein